MSDTIGRDSSTRESYAATAIQMTDAMRADAGDPNRDRAYLADAPPAQMDDVTLAQPPVSEGEDEPGSDAQAARDA